MRPALFRYSRPETLEEALEIKAEYGDEANVLAGGQSLVPMLNMRVARPGILVDINKLATLAQVLENAQSITIGAVTRYAHVAVDASLVRYVPLLAQAIPLVAHAGVRNRGTLGGSLALADPAAECPACCVSLEGQILLTSRSRGNRIVSAEEFIQGTYTTLLEPDELIVSIELNKSVPNQRFAIREVSVRHGDFALAGLCANATLEGGKFQKLRLVYFGVGDRPILIQSASQILIGAGRKYRDAIPDAVAALRNDMDFADGPELSADSRRHLTETLLKRVLDDLEGASTHVG